MTFELGLGLLSIGRTWGIHNKPPPSEEQALNVIKTAYEKGIRFFDTAPAYGTSEARLGRAFQKNYLQRQDTLCATKMGEYWDFEKDTSYVSHTYDDLIRGLENSLKLLGAINVLQLHKATPDNIDIPDVMRAFDHAEKCGITSFGASVSDIETARRACLTGRYTYLQFPYNRDNTKLDEIFTLLQQNSMKAIINRPFAMGALAFSKNQPMDNSESFQFILAKKASGVILTGTSSSEHLVENITDFQKATSKV